MAVRFRGCYSPAMDIDALLGQRSQVFLATKPSSVPTRFSPKPHIAVRFPGCGIPRAGRFVSGLSSVTEERIFPIVGS
jgi:hypothetical protein